MTQQVRRMSQVDVDWAKRHMPISAQVISWAETRASLRNTVVTFGVKPDAKTLAVAGMLASAGCTVGFLENDLDTSFPFPVWDVPNGIVIAARHAKTTDNSGAGIDLDQSALRVLFEDTIGIGQASVMALVDITNLQLAGRPVCVTGYTLIGKSIADYAKALGARVTVLEHDPILALKAIFDGHFLAENSDMLDHMDVVFVTSKDAASLVSKRLTTLRTGALLCNVADEVTNADFGLPENGEAVRNHVVQHQVTDDSFVKLIAHGAPIHLAAADGFPIDVSDVTCALWAAAIEQLSSATDLNGIQPLDPRREAGIAQAILDRQRNKQARPRS